MALSESRPFDCSLIDENDDDLNLIPCEHNGPQWKQIGVQVLWSVGIWFILIISSPFLSSFWKKYSNNQVCPYWVQQYVGTTYRNAHDYRIEVAVCFADGFGSFILLVIWIQKSYEIHKHENLDHYVIELICVFFCSTHVCFQRIKHNFGIQNAFSLVMFLNCLTLPPLIMQPFGEWSGGSWLTLGYFRAFHWHATMKRLVELNVYDQILSNFAQQCLIAVLECLVVVFFISGTLYIMEGLGDIEGFSDQFIDSGMGEISFFQMVYFSFVTISTVGFGDFSPTTVLSRTFIIFAILGGVSFFSYISVQVMQLIEVESSGRGEFIPSRKSGRGHILVMGGGITCGSLTVLETFMRALCRDDKFYHAPDIVMMGPTACTPEVREMLKSEWAQGFNIQYFLGSPFIESDLIRVRASEASMVFIIADFQATDTKKEDTSNSLMAASFQQSLPKVQYRLMLCSIRSISFCSYIGLSEYNCFSIESFKAGMFGMSMRCPGYSTMILNFGLPILPVPNTNYSTEIYKDKSYSKWLNEFAQGCSYKIFGFHPNDTIIGLTFKQAAIKIATITDVLIIAVQIDGALVINPSNHIITSETVLMGLGQGASNFSPISRNHDASVASWIKQFQLNRQVGSFKTRIRNKSVYMNSESEIDDVYDSMEKTPIEGQNPLQFRPSQHSRLSQHSNNSDDQTMHIPSPSANLSSVGPPVFSTLSDNFTQRNMSGGEGGGRNSWSRALRERSSYIRAKKLAAEMQGMEGLSNEEEISLLKNIVKFGGHTVILVLEDSDDLDQQTVWEQILIILKCGFSANDMTPIVIVHTLSAIPSRQNWFKKNVSFLNQCANISFCIGDILNPLILQAAGCHIASRILTIAPSAPALETNEGSEIVIKSEDKMDETNIFLVNIFNQYKAVWKRNEEFQMIFDWYTPGSMNILPIPPLKTFRKLSQEPTESLVVTSLESDDVKTPRSAAASSSSSAKVTPLPPTPVPSSSSGPPPVSCAPTESEEGLKLMTTDDIEFACSEPRGNCRFAAGYTIPKPFIAALYSMAYYTPGFLELIEALLIPSRYDQKSIIWLFTIPPQFTDKEYNQLAHELLEAGTLPLGLLRPGGIEAGTPFPYVMTLVPSSKLSLNSHDSIYVLAEVAWAKEEASKLGLSPH